MFKVGLISGHGAGDCGAIGNGYKEADLTVEVVKMLDASLQARGIGTKVYPYERNAFKDGKLVVDFSDCDYCLEVHFNSFNGSAHGTEIYVTTSEKGTSVESKIVANLSALGFYNRGVKRYNYDVISNVKRQGTSSALLEVCFIDNTANMNLFNQNRQAVVDAIVNGIVDGFGLDAPKVEAPKPTPTPAPTQSGKVDAAKSFDKNIAGKYNTTANLYLRMGAGTDKTAICLMPKGCSVRCYGYFTEVDGVKWFYVEYSGKQGFCSSQYLA